MKSFSDYNPLVTAVWFLCTVSVSMFCNRPETVLISFLGAVVFFSIKNRGMKTHIFFAVLLVILSLANPLANHRGTTVLFVANNNPITLEATIYGINSAFMIVGTLYWLRSFTQIMTADRLFYITGRISDKSALLLSMIVRFVPMLKSQAEKIKGVQKTMGIYGDESLADRITGGMRVFSSLATWSLENGIITADSMTARGYGSAKRTQYTDFRMTFQDCVFLSVTLLLYALFIVSAGLKGLEVQFYPSFRLSDYNFTTVLGIVSCTVLSFMPVTAEIWSEIKWKLLRSEI